MDLLERDNPDTRRADPPGTTALSKGLVALVLGFILGVVAFALAAFGIFPALALLLLAVPLAWWGSKKLKANESQLAPID